MRKVVCWSFDVTYPGAKGSPQPVKIIIDKHCFSVNFTRDRKFINFKPMFLCLRMVKENNELRKERIRLKKKKLLVVTVTCSIIDWMFEQNVKNQIKLDFKWKVFWPNCSIFELYYGNFHFRWTPGTRF